MKVVCLYVFRGHSFPLHFGVSITGIFSDLAVGEIAAILSAAKVECGGGRNATAAKPLKIPVTETPK